MAYTVEYTLPSYEQVFGQLPLTSESAAQIAQHRIEIENILTGKDHRKIMIVGPCSAWPSSAVVEYGSRLAPLAEELKDSLKIVMRTYIQKPRTITGWMGPLVQPDPFAEPNTAEGIFYCRKMMLDVIQMGLPIADEILFPRYQSYFRDLLSWAAIGARSSENQEHRVLASLLEFPIGIKNPTSGSIRIGVNSVRASQAPNYLAMAGNQVKTSGNPYAHLVLRGGNSKPNISTEHLQKAHKYLTENAVQNPSIIVDISHDNTRDADGNKDYTRQKYVLESTLKSMQKDTQIHSIIKGWMAESYLEAGSQKLNSCGPDACVPGKSITDGCLGWNETEALLRELAHTLTIQK